MIIQKTGDLPTVYIPQRGFTLLEMLLQLTVLTSCLVIMAYYPQQLAQQATAVAATLQLKQVSQAAELYILDHFQDVTRQKYPPVVSLQTLIDNNYLPPRVVPSNHRRNYQIKLLLDKQQWQLWIIPPSGKKISKAAWQQLEHHLGISTGYTSSIKENSSLTGWGNLWQLPWPKQLGKFPGNGRVIALQSINPPEIQEAALLYRKEFIRSPYLNQMRVPLELRQHQVKFKENEQYGTVTSSQCQFNCADNYLSVQPQSIELRNKDNGLTLSQEEINFKENTTQNFSTATIPTLKFKITSPKNSNFLIRTVRKTVNIVQAFLRNCFEFIDFFKNKNNKLKLQSASNIRHYGNQVPVYIFKKNGVSNLKLEKFANAICHIGLTEDSIKEYYIKTFGRLFIIINKYSSHSTNDFYICWKSKQHLFAYSLIKFDTLHNRDNDEYNLPVLKKNKTFIPKIIEFLKKICEEAVGIISIHESFEKYYPPDELNNFIDNPDIKYKKIEGKIMKLILGNKSNSIKIENTYNEIFKKYGGSGNKKIYSNIFREKYNKLGTHKTYFQSLSKQLNNKLCKEKVEKFLASEKNSHKYNIHKIEKLLQFLSMENDLVVNNYLLELLTILLKENISGHDYLFHFCGGIIFPREITNEIDSKHITNFLKNLLKNIVDDLEFKKINQQGWDYYNSINEIISGLNDSDFMQYFNVGATKNYSPQESDNNSQLREFIKKIKHFNKIETAQQPYILKYIRSQMIKNIEHAKKNKNSFPLELRFFDTAPEVLFQLTTTEQGSEDEFEASNDYNEFNHSYQPNDDPPATSSCD